MFKERKTSSELLFSRPIFFSLPPSCCSCFWLFCCTKYIEKIVLFHKSQPNECWILSFSIRMPTLIRFVDQIEYRCLISNYSTRATTTNKSGDWQRNWAKWLIFLYCDQRSYGFFLFYETSHSNEWREWAFLGASLENEIILKNHGKWNQKSFQKVTCCSFHKSWALN